MINTEIYNYTKTNISSTTQIYWGHLPDNVDYEDGTINFFRLPSQMEDRSGTTLAAYQFSVRHTDLYQAYQIKEELIDVWLNYGEKLGDRQVTVFFDSEQGEIWEDNDRIVHLPITLNFKYIR